MTSDSQKGRSRMAEDWVETLREAIRCGAEDQIWEARRHYREVANDDVTPSRERGGGSSGARSVRPESSDSGPTPEIGTALRIDVGVRLDAALDEAIKALDDAVAISDSADQGRYTSALVLLVATRKSLHEAGLAKLISHHIACGLGGEHTGIAELDNLCARIREQAPFDPSDLSDEQKSELPLLGMLAEFVDEQHMTMDTDPLADSARRLSMFVAEEWGKKEIDAIPPRGPAFTRAEWARETRRVVQLAIDIQEIVAEAQLKVARGDQLSEMDERALALTEKAPSDPAVRHVGGIVRHLRAAGAIPELRDLVSGSPDGREFLQPYSKAVREVQHYLGSTRRPDPEAIIRRVLISFGYAKRKAHSLFESIDKAEKRRAARSSRFDK